MYSVTQSSGRFFFILGAIIVTVVSVMAAVAGKLVAQMAMLYQVR